MKRYLVMLCILAGLFVACESGTAPTPEATLPPVTTAPTVPSSAPTETTGPLVGWREENGIRWYYFADGSYATGWYLIDGNHYHFDANGAMQTGWITIQGNRYYLGTDGVRRSGWLDLDGKRYYLAETGILHTGWLEQDGKRYYMDASGVLQTGWTNVDQHRYYLNADGVLQTGWLELDGKRYYLGNSGILHTGWLSLDGKEYYLKSDGSMARGTVQINGAAYHFTSTGQPIILVNPWNLMPSDYTVTLKYVTDWHRVDASCYDALMQMLADCRAAGFNAQVRSSYRTQADQEYLYGNKVQYYRDLGYGEAEAKRLAGTVVAVPGTSEHQLGLAVDLVDNNNWSLDSSQEKMPAQQWLMQNSWRYGFILRYPSNKSEYTGIIYEPWHYRYVGTELAKELYDSGMCLEEYLAALTE